MPDDATPVAQRVSHAALIDVHRLGLPRGRHRRRRMRARPPS